MYRLLELAQEAHSKHPERSKRYIQLLERISTRYRMRMPLDIKTAYCKHCKTPWKEGFNIVKRVKGSMLNATCKECKTTKRYRLGTPPGKRF